MDVNEDIVEEDDFGYKPGLDMESVPDTSKDGGKDGK